MRSLRRSTHARAIRPLSAGLASGPGRSQQGAGTTIRPLLAIAAVLLIAALAMPRAPEPAVPADGLRPVGASAPLEPGLADRRAESNPVGGASAPTAASVVPDASAESEARPTPTPTPRPRRVRKRRDARKRPAPARQATSQSPRAAPPVAAPAAATPPAARPPAPQPRPASRPRQRTAGSAAAEEFGP